MTLAIGMLSTARINAKLAAGARASSRTRVVAIASRHSSAPRRRRASSASKARTAATRRCWPIRPSTRSTSPCPTRCITTGRWRPSPPASTCSARSRTHAPLRRARGGVLGRRGRRPPVLAEAFMWRHHPQALRLTELIADGAIGDLRLVRAAFSFMLDDPRDVRLLEELDGGGTMDVGCYCISAARLLAGEPVSVTAQQLLRAVGRRPSPRRDARPRGRRPLAPRLRARPARPQRPRGRGLGGRPARQRSLAQRAHGHRALVRGNKRTEYFEIPPADPYGCELDDSRRGRRGGASAAARAGRRPRSGAHDRRRAARGGQRSARERLGPRAWKRTRPSSRRSSSWSRPFRPPFQQRRANRSQAATAVDGGSGRRAAAPRARGSFRPRAPARAPSAAGGSAGARACPLLGPPGPGARGSGRRPVRAAAARRPARRSSRSRTSWWASASATTNVTTARRGSDARDPKVGRRVPRSQREQRRTRARWPPGAHAACAARALARGLRSCCRSGEQAEAEATGLAPQDFGVVGIQGR